MGQFKKYGGSRPKDFSFGGGNSGGQKKFGGRDRDRGDRGSKQLFDATCGDCGKQCQVPFRPTGKHPVFCSDCFRNKDERGSRYTPKESVRSNRESFNRNSGRSTAIVSEPVVQAGISQKQFDSLEKKLDDILSLLHTQRRDKEFSKESKKEEKKTEKKPTKKVAEKKVEKKVAKKVAKKAVKKSVKKAPAKKVVKKKAVAKKVAPKKKKAVAKKK